VKKGERLEEKRKTLQTKREASAVRKRGGESGWEGMKKVRDEDTLKSSSQKMSSLRETSWWRGKTHERE